MNGLKTETAPKLQPIKRKGSTGSHSHISTPSSPSSNVPSPFQSVGTPVGGVAVTIGSGTTGSPDELTLECLGIKIGDRVTIDSGTSKAKVPESAIGAS